MCNRAAERVGLNVIREAPATVDLHHRQPLPVGLLERRIIRDVDLAQVELELVAEIAHLLEGALAEMAAGGVVDDDPMDRCHA